MNKLIDDIQSLSEISALKKLRQTQYYQAFKKRNPNYYKEHNDKSRLENFEKSLFYQTKSLAKKRKLEFNIIIADVIIPEICSLTDTIITKLIGNGKMLTNPYIYRVDESKGYFKENIIITCVLANYLRSLASKEQIVAFARNMTKIHR